MPKRTAYSRSGAQRSKTRQKSFELVRPASESKELETAESNEEADVVDTEHAEIVTTEVEEVEEGEEEEEKEAKVEKVKEKVGRNISAKAQTPAPVVATPASSTPKSASARLAARRQTAQKMQRSSANLIIAENYGYVRKDLIFILILAVIMFSAIIVLHFILGS
jgi:hypothetical protein